jgi:2-dehydropantoate 2-reductase
MRFVVFGAGAIGGVVGGRLHQAGHPVILIARGAHLEAIRSHGLILETPMERVVLRLPAAGDPAAVDWRDDDVVLLATKSQDTSGALAALRDAAGPQVPVVCVQNGVENERVALRLMDSVYGATVMLPAAHLEPGVVQAYGTRLTGMIDLGRYPEGVDDRCREVASALAESSFTSAPVGDIMRLKHAKLLLNLNNVVEALCGPGEETRELTGLASAEGRAALEAAGIDFVAEDVTDVQERWKRMGVAEIGGRPRVGSSTSQSLARGTGTIETDYLNGEIVLQGRLHGVPTPINEALCVIAARVVRDDAGPGGLGSIPVSDVLAAAA